MTNQELYINTLQHMELTITLQCGAKIPKRFITCQTLLGLSFSLAVYGVISKSLADIHVN